MSDSPPSPPAPPPPQKLTLTLWLILIMAAIGFAFDIYELLMLPLVLPPALRELLPRAEPGSAEFNNWRALMFWVPAMAGGVFGLVGGYLTDYLGRRRVLTWSILLYAVSAFLAGYSTSMTMLLILRTTTFIGVCIEFVAAVAWLAELFPNPKQREMALGYTQAFSSIGGLLVGGVFYLITIYANTLPPIALPEFLSGALGTIDQPHAPWRYTLISGILPAVPLLLIRPFLPESPVWKSKKDAGTLKRPDVGELFSPRLARTTWVTTIMVGCSYGAAFGAIQQMPQIAPGLPHVREGVARAMEEPQYKDKLDKVESDTLKLARERNAAPVAPEIKEEMNQGQARRSREQAVQKLGAPVVSKYAAELTLWQEVGGLVGRFLFALLAVRILSRRSLLRLFQVPGLLVVPIVFALFGTQNQTLLVIDGKAITLMHVGMFLAGVLVVAQFSFWGNYLPLVYPTHLRGTGESFAHNVGGRMLGTSFAAITSVVSGLPFVPGADDPTRVAYTAGGVALFVFLVGLLFSFALPEPKEEEFLE